MLASVMGIPRQACALMGCLTGSGDIVACRLTGSRGLLHVLPQGGALGGACVLPHAAVPCAC
eukprot:36684-Chlamydomonas_euryale.AAC.2